MKIVYDQHNNFFGKWWLARRTTLFSGPRRNQNSSPCFLINKICFWKLILKRCFENNIFSWKTKTKGERTVNCALLLTLLLTSVYFYINIKIIYNVNFLFYTLNPTDQNSRCLGSSLSHLATRSPERLFVRLLSYSLSNVILVLCAEEGVIGPPWVAILWWHLRKRLPTMSGVFNERQTFHWKNCPRMRKWKT